MEFRKFADDLNIISALGDNPGADNGLTANGLKAKFDEAALKIQKYINEVLIEDIYGAVESEEFRGPTGPSPTITVGRFTEGASTGVKLHITNPDNGDQLGSEQVISILDGADGITPNIANVTVEMLEPEEEATASVSGTADNLTLALGLPMGATGRQGPSGTPRNWLDNSNFLNVVNQRGQSFYSGSRVIRGFDRWTLISECSMEIITGGVAIYTGTFVQNFSDSVKTALYGKTVTAAIRDVNGNGVVISGDFNTGFWGENGGVSCEVTTEHFAITLYDVSLHHPQFALYIGEYTDENVPEYQPKGYAAELLECQRYYREFGTWRPLTTGYVDYLGILRFTIPVSTQFRITPTASALTGAQVVVDGSDYTIPDGVIPRVVNSDANAVHFNLDEQFTLPDHAKQPFVIYLQGTPFTLSAEL